MGETVQVPSGVAGVSGDPVELKSKSLIELQQQMLLYKRAARIEQARNSMKSFMHFMMPDTADPDDAEKTEYQENAVGDCLCDLIEQIEDGRKRRVGASTPPQHGKTAHLSLYGAAWILGRNPKTRIVVSTYNETRAKELGKDLLSILRSPQYQQVFPQIKLDPSAQSQSYIQTLKGGRVMLVGAGGSITGKTAHFFLIDDPIKGEEDESDLTPTALERLWQWFFKVAFSRGSNKTRILITHTRWAEDDLLGRLCDPNHPERDKRFKGIASKWFYLNLPAVVKDPELAKQLGLTLDYPDSIDSIEMFGGEPMTTLWPESKDLDFFAEWKRGDPRSFAALAMGQPAPEDGEYFKSDWLMEYEPGQLPSRDRLQIFGGSDHAVSVKQGRDYTVLGCCGVDEDENIWVLPELVWDRMETDRTVEEMLQNMQRHKPLMWWAEDDNIKKAFGPFLIKRMSEERVYTVLDGIRPSADKKTRARSIQGRMAAKKVYFPSYAPWWPDAKAQLLRFPHAAHDDFVDWLSMFGMGLLKEYGVAHKKPSNDNVVKSGSIEWILAQTRRQERIKRESEGRSTW